MKSKSGWLSVFLVLTTQCFGWGPTGHRVTCLIAEKHLTKKARTSEMKLLNGPTWFNDQSNLHRVWDSDMIDDTRLSYTELAESLDRPSQAQIREWQRSSIHEWAQEGQSYLEDVYHVGNGRLGYRYSYNNMPLVRHRLLQAGIRLAGLLNETYT